MAPISSTTIPVKILLNEDNASDVQLIQETPPQKQTPNTLNMMRASISARAFLGREAVYADASRPDLILLDLNLPGKNGFDLLRAPQAVDSWKRIPVVALTSSDGQEDVNRSYDLNVNGLLTKPWDWDQFAEMVSGVEKFRFSIVRLPVKTP
ncbi:MAG: response regulator [Candidatus Marinimicrobia bacterium]|nr:response regulator [Candidatus Neomarinimicrobiota bacterium]